MKNLIRIYLATLLLAGCYAAAEKKEKPVVPEDALNDFPNTSSLLSRTEFKKYYREIETFYQRHLEASRFNGAILVAKNGEIIFEKYAGTVHTHQSDTINASTPFHLASVSKTFTGMAILKLWEQGKLNIEAEVSAYLPGFNYPGVTVKTLLNHRSGLPNYVHVMEKLGWDRTRIASNADVLQFLIDRKNDLPVGLPDRHFSYCNTNYALLALVIEKVSGQSYPDFLKHTFFEPLKMENSFVCTSDSAYKLYPSYNWRNQEEGYTFLDAVYGDKNVFSTARDLLKWDQALCGDTLFTPTTLEAAYCPYSFEKPGVRNYGLGWRMLVYPDQKKIIYHNGWWHGNNTLFCRMVQDSATIIVLGNHFNRRIYQAKKLYPIFTTVGDETDDDE